MKIKSINTIEWFENKEAYIQYLLMNDDVSKIQRTLDSLDNPLSVTEALENAKELIWENEKISYLLNSITEEEKNVIILNILLSSFMNNNGFSKELELFIRKKSSVIAWAKVETGMTIAKYANKVYKPINNLNYKPKVWDTNELLAA